MARNKTSFWKTVRAVANEVNRQPAITNDNPVIARHGKYGARVTVFAASRPGRWS